MLKPIPMSANVSRPAKQLGGGCMMLFGLPFILAGLAVGWFMHVPALAGWWSARHWEEVPCWIEKAEMKTSRSSKGGTSYHASAGYRYEYRGRTYRSEDVTFTHGSDNIGDFQKTAYAQIKPLAGQDRPFRCYVNPAQPEQVVLFRDLRWGMILMMSIFPTVFPLAGAGVAIGGWLQARKAALGRKLAARHPDEPWRWRKEWAGDVIQASSDHLPVILFFAGWILLVQAPLAAAVVVSGELANSPMSAFALLPCLLALIPLWLAWKRIQTRRVLGRPVLQLNQTPVMPGRTLEGELRFGHVLSPLMTVGVRALCQRKIIRRTGKGTSTTIEKVWEHTETLSASEARRDMSGVALPLRIDIPRGLPCPAAEEAAYATASGDQHEWSLELRPGSGGSAAVLPLPMFRTAQEPEPADPDSGHEVEPMALSTEQLTKQLQLRGLTAAFDDAGIPTLIDCPPGRFRGLGIFLLLFGIVWFVIFLVLVKQGAPWLFRIVWGVTSPLVILVGLRTLLHRRLVVIAPDELRIEHSIGPFYSWKEIYAPRHITGFMHNSNMQSGNQLYYRVRAKTTFGKIKTVADGITESVTAGTLARRLEDWRKKRG